MILSVTKFITYLKPKSVPTSSVTDFLVTIPISNFSYSATDTKHAQQQVTNGDTVNI